MAARRKSTKRIAKRGARAAGKSGAARASSAPGASRGAGARGAGKAKSAKGRSARGRASKSARTPRADIRSRIHDFTLRAVRDGDLSLRDIPVFARDVVKDAASGLNSAVPQSSRNVLRQVVDGLTDAATATASSAKSAISATTTRGSEFVRKDASRVVKDLRALEGNFLSALQHAGKSLQGAARDEMDSILKHAKHAGTRIRPAAERTAKAIDGRVMELGAETAKAGVRATRSAVGGALRGAGGLLDALGEAVRGSSRGRS